MQRRSLLLVFFLCFFTFAISCGQQKKYVQYSVKQGETMRTIARKLEMRTKDLLRLNPNIGRKPQANTVIVIPNNKLNFTEDTSQKEVIVVSSDNEEEVLKNIKEKETFHNEIQNITKDYEIRMYELLLKSKMAEIEEAYPSKGKGKLGYTPFKRHYLAMALKAKKEKRTLNKFSRGGKMFNKIGTSLFIIWVIACTILSISKINCSSFKIACFT